MGSLDLSLLALADADADDGVAEDDGAGDGREVVDAAAGLFPLFVFLGTGKKERKLVRESCNVIQNCELT